MPDYVCPECGNPLTSRAVLIDGTLMHFVCLESRRAAEQARKAAHFNNFLARQRREREYDQQQAAG